MDLDPGDGFREKVPEILHFLPVLDDFAVVAVDHLFGGAGVEKGPGLVLIAFQLEGDGGVAKNVLSPVPGFCRLAQNAGAALVVGGKAGERICRQPLAEIRGDRPILDFLRRSFPPRNRMPFSRMSSGARPAILLGRNPAKSARATEAAMDPFFHSVAAFSSRLISGRERMAIRLPGVQVRVPAEDFLEVGNADLPVPAGARGAQQRSGSPCRKKETVAEEKAFAGD